VDRAPSNEFDYWLSAYVFAAFPRVFPGKDELESELALLPTAGHIRSAREQLGPSEL
jgi:hypothetical protein